MSGTMIADLAVLGIAHQHPLPVDRIAVIAKALVPDLWQPTRDVIAASGQRNLKAHFLNRNCQNSKADELVLTDAGSNQVIKLLRHDTGDHTQPSTLVLDALQFCFLDFADTATKISVLNRHTARLERRLAQFEDRCRKCPHQGRFSRMWMAAERSRFECMARLLEDVSAEPAESHVNNNKFHKETE